MTVLEKRTQYTRLIWFDLMPAPLHPAGTLQQLHHWGVHLLAAQSQPDADTGVLSMRCQSLERALAWVALAVGVRVQYGHTVSRLLLPATVCTSACLLAVAHSPAHASLARRVAAAALEATAVSGTTVRVDWDVLIAADGARSAARAWLGIGWRARHAIHRFGSSPCAGQRDARCGGSDAPRAAPLPLRVPGLQQATVIARFAPGPAGCQSRRSPPLSCTYAWQRRRLPAGAARRMGRGRESAGRAL